MKVGTILPVVDVLVNVFRVWFLLATLFVLTLACLRQWCPAGHLVFVTTNRVHFRLAIVLGLL